MSEENRFYKVPTFLCRSQQLRFVQNICVPGVNTNRKQITEAMAVLLQLFKSVCCPCANWLVPIVIIILYKILEYVLKIWNPFGIQVLFSFILQKCFKTFSLDRR